MSCEALHDPGSWGLGGFCKAETWGMDVGRMLERPTRMEAVFYGSDGYLALEAMRRSRFAMTQLGELADVIWPGVFARRFVQDPAYGVPFLSTSMMMEARPKPKQYLSLRNTRNLPAYLVDEGTILVSRSGTVGNVVIVTQDLAGSAVSEDALRVRVRNPVDLGVVYCFLQSVLGQFLLKRSQTGSVVRHIYESDVAQLPIPILPLGLRQELTQRIRQVSTLRVEANRLLDEIEPMLQDQLRLPPMASFEDTSSNPVTGKGTCFSIRAMDRIVTDGGYGQLRIDATYYHPTASRLRQHLATNEGMRLGDLLIGVRNSNLRKRVYVDNTEKGVPLIGGKQLTALRPQDLKFLSGTHTKGLKEERVREGWSLVSCGGTVGRTLFVHRNYDDWVMSQHVMRLIPNPAKVYPGFIAAFVASVYGQVQLEQLSYGSVQKELRQFHFLDVLTALPADRGMSIHEQVVDAYDRRADAHELEDEAFALFMEAVERGCEPAETQ